MSTGFLALVITDTDTDMNNLLSIKLSGTIVAMKILYNIS